MEEIAFIRASKKVSSKQFQITIPGEAVRKLNLQGGEKLKVLIDVEKGTLTYQRVVTA